MALSTFAALFGQDGSEPCWPFPHQLMKISAVCLAFPSSRSVFNKCAGECKPWWTFWILIFGSLFRGGERDEESGVKGAVVVC